MGLVGLSDIRKQAGLSQRQVADKVGCSHTAVQQWEAKGDAPSLAYLPRVVAALNLSPAVAADLRQRAVDYQLGRAEDAA